MQGDGHEQAAARPLAAVGEDDGLQRRAGAAQAGDGTLVDRDARRAQPLGVRRRRAPRGRRRAASRRRSRRAAGARRCAPVAPRSSTPSALVADLPAVAERAVEHGAAPALGDPGERRVPVVHAGGEQDPPRRSRASRRRARATKPPSTRSPLDHLARRAPRRPGSRELGAPGGVEAGRRAAVLAEQAADAVGDEVALAARVDDQRPPAGAAEHERGAQPGGARRRRRCSPSSCPCAQRDARRAICQADLP